MNIGIDARGLWEKKSGIGIYIEQVIKELNEKDQENKYILYSTKDIVLDYKLNENFEVKKNIKGIGSLWFYFKLPKILKEDNIDVYWGTQHLLPKRNKYTKNIKFVLTIHDLAIKKLKIVGSLKNTIVQKIFLKKSLRNADKIIAISKATKKDIAELYKIDDNKVKVIYNGTNLNDEKLDISNDKKQEIAEKFGIKDTPYLFFLSTIEPRKNIETLILAFNYIKRRENTKLKLIIAGGFGWKYQSVLELIQKSDYKEDIFMPGYITKEEKKYLYENTICFVYPSLYEGFGLPVLEAMANKALVITSDVSSLPEVGGSIAYYYESVLNYGNLGNKILEVMHLGEEDKQARINQGLEQVKKFTWEKCAKETLDIFKQK